VKDLIAEGSTDGDWTYLVRPLHTIHPDDDIESALGMLQSEGATISLVEDAGSPVGLITIEDILEQVVGRIEDEYSDDPNLLLTSALNAGNVVLELAGRTAEHVIRELATAIPAESLPPMTDVAELAVAREFEVSTDLGVGIAIPHARCPNLVSPLIVFGRSTEGVIFSPQSDELVHFVFLLVTPLERPDVQLFLLGQLARIAGDAAARERLSRATSREEVIDVVTQRRAGLAVSEET
jgi:mannitol/fructose-specific phosphotransferase system IIA component (Ntr-type)